MVRALRVVDAIFRDMTSMQIHSANPCMRPCVRFERDAAMHCLRAGKGTQPV
jgi:hypothetical protein